jgi:integrase
MGVKVREWKGAWWLFVDHKGKRKAKRIGIGKDAKREAKKHAKKIEARLILGDLGILAQAPAVPTFATVAEEWLRKYPMRHAIRPSTVENYTSFTRRHLIPYFGEMKITAITSETIEGFIEAKRASGGAVRGGKGLADAALKVSCFVLASILRRARKDRLITSNPWDDAEWSSARPIEHVDPFTPAELRAILGAAGAIDRDLAVLLRVWAQTGARAGEIFALRPEDMDHDRGVVLIRRTWSRKRLGPTKTGRERNVSFLHPVTETTSEWRPGVTPDSRAVLAALNSLEVQPIDPTGFLFTRKGAPWSARTFNGVWRRVLARAHVRYRNPEQLRHTLASVLLSRNAPLLYVQRVGGWNSAKMLLDVYARWLPQDGVDFVPGQPSATPAQPGQAVQRVNA